MQRACSPTRNVDSQCCCLEARGQAPRPVCRYAAADGHPALQGPAKQQAKAPIAAPEAWAAAAHGRQTEAATDQRDQHPPSGMRPDGQMAQQGSGSPWTAPIGQQPSKGAPTAKA